MVHRSDAPHPRMNSTALAFYPAFKTLYSHGLGLISKAGGCLPLHRACPHSLLCWRREVGRPLPPSSHIYLPWIGPQYRRSGLLVLGHNMNDAGGLGVCYEGTPIAQRELLSTQRVRYGKQTYSGSLFENWMLASAQTVLMRLDLAPFENDAELESAAQKVRHPKRAQFVGGYDLIAVTNAVKCGPRPRKANSTGSPTTEMQNRCPTFILEREITILQPRVILGLGKPVKDMLERLKKRGSSVGTIATVFVHHPSQGFSPKRDLASLREQLDQLSWFSQA